MSPETIISRVFDTKGVVFSDLIKRDGAVEIEVGCGKGKFIVERAGENPDTDFIAMDRVTKFMKKGFVRAERRGLKNLLFLKIDAREFIREVVPDKRVNIFHVYFPDPWPKWRHRKRRILTPDFFTLLHQKTASGGLLEIATDHEDYYGFIKASHEKVKHLWTLRQDQKNSRVFSSSVKTNYEVKWEREGRTLHYLEFQKCD